MPQHHLCTYLYYSLEVPRMGHRQPPNHSAHSVATVLHSVSRCLSPWLGRHLDPAGPTYVASCSHPEELLWLLWLQAEYIWWVHGFNVNRHILSLDLGEMLPVSLSHIRIPAAQHRAARLMPDRQVGTHPTGSSSSPGTQGHTEGQEGHRYVLSCSSVPLPGTFKNSSDSPTAPYAPGSKGHPWRVPSTPLTAGTSG